MSLIIGNGMCITYIEPMITCPICGQPFDVAKKMDTAQTPIFNIKCPKCKGKITISVPIMGGFTKCWETHCPSNVKRLETITPNHVNGITYLPDDLIKQSIDSSKYDEDDEEKGDGDAPNPIITNNPPKKF